MLMWSGEATLYFTRSSLTRALTATSRSELHASTRSAFRAIQVLIAP